VHVHAAEANNPYSAPAGDRASTGGQPSAAVDSARPSLTPWVLFTIFIFGPCEPLIPVLMYPAAKADPLAIVVVTALFGAATLIAMTGMVVCLRAGAGAVRFRWLDRYNHALAGLVVLGCGIAIKLGW
jgi:nickel/cobalt transporter (NicO) family protein